VNRRSRADGDYAIEDADRRSRREAFRQLVRPDRNGAAQTRLKDAELVIADGAPGREKALAGPWPEVLVQRCTIHRHRNLLAHAPDRLHEEISADYKGMIYAATKQEVEAKRKAFIRKWRLKCPAVAALLEEAGDKLFTFTRTFTECRKAMEIASDLECNPTIAPDQNSDRPAIGRNSRDVVLGSAGFGGRSQRAKSMAGKASAKSHPIRRLISPYDQETAPCWRSRQNTNSNRNRDSTLDQAANSVHHIARRYCRLDA
jgi:Transposase, Mutator family